MAERPPERSRHTPPVWREPCDGAGQGRGAVGVTPCGRQRSAGKLISYLLHLKSMLSHIKVTMLCN